jgi:regulator of replication initiation timing
MQFKNLFVPCCALLQHAHKKIMSTGSGQNALHKPQQAARGGLSCATTKNRNKVSSRSTGSTTSATSGSSRKRGHSDDEDSSTLSCSRAEELEEELDRVTRENMELVIENEKLMELWETEKQEKEQYHKRVMKKALQTVTMERETYAKVKRYAQEKLFRFVKFITSENELRDLVSPSSIANHTMDELEIA